MSGNPPTYPPLEGPLGWHFFPSGWLGKSQELIRWFGGLMVEEVMSNHALGARWNPSDFPAGSKWSQYFNYIPWIFRRFSSTSKGFFWKVNFWFFSFFGWWNSFDFLVGIFTKVKQGSNSIHLKGFPRSDGFCHWVLSFLLGFPDSSDPRVDTVSSDTPILSCGGFKYFLMFTPVPGEMIQID